MENPEESNHNSCRWFWDYLILFTKFWGIFTSVVLCGVGVDLLVHHHTIGVYITLASLGLFILETAWAVALYLKVSIQNEYSRIFACWEAVLWVKEWKKTIIYVGSGFGLLYKSHYLWLLSDAGIMLIILGFLHLLLLWKDKIRGYSKEALMDNQDSYYDSLQEIDDPNLENPGGAVSNSAIAIEGSSFAPSVTPL